MDPAYGIHPGAGSFEQSVTVSFGFLLETFWILTGNWELRASHWPWGSGGRIGGLCFDQMVREMWVPHRADVSCSLGQYLPVSLTRRVVFRVWDSAWGRANG